MCEANAYILDNEEETLFMEAVDTVAPDGDGLRLTSIFGEQKFIKANIHALSLVNHKVLLMPEKNESKVSPS